MQRYMMKSKVHRATVTGADLDYEGSIGIDEALMESADLLPNEKVDVYNITNGERFSTYVIPEQKNSGAMVLNGAAARRATVGDLIIVVSYCMMEEKEARGLSPRIIMVDEHNRITKGGPPKFIRQMTTR